MTNPKEQEETELTDQELEDAMETDDPVPEDVAEPEEDDDNDGA